MTDKYRVTIQREPEPEPGAPVGYIIAAIIAGVLLISLLIGGQ